MIQVLIDVKTFNLIKKQRIQFNITNIFVLCLKYIFNIAAKIKKDTQSWKVINLEQHSDIFWVRWPKFTSLLYATLTLQTVKLIDIIREDIKLQDQIKAGQMIGYNAKTKQLIRTVNNQVQVSGTRLGNLYLDEHFKGRYKRMIRRILFKKSYYTWYGFCLLNTKWKTYTKQHQIHTYVERLLIDYVSKVYNLTEQRVNLLFDVVTGEIYYEPVNIDDSMQDIIAQLMQNVTGEDIDIEYYEEEIEPEPKKKTELRILNFESEENNDK